MKKQIILLNGPSSSGKSTLSKALQELIEEKRNEKYVIISIDDFMKLSTEETIYEDDVFEGDDKLSWTKNYLLRKWNWSACEYEIRKVEGIEYMIIEWKSGDYRFGGFDTNYYVFVKA